MQKSFRAALVSSNTPRMMLRSNSQLRRAAVFSTVLLFLVGSGVCQNIDTEQPIVRSVPGNQDDQAFFGYTLVLHQTNSNPGNLANAVSGARYDTTYSERKIIRDSQFYNSIYACVCPVFAYAMIYFESITFNDSNL